MTVNITVIDKDFDWSKAPERVGGSVNSWYQDDRRFFENPKSLAKAKAVLEARGLDFDIFITPGKPLGNGDMAKIGIKPTAGRTTIVFTNNVSQPWNWKPLNAWIICHRLGHVFQGGTTANGMPHRDRSALQAMDSGILNAIAGLWNAGTVSNGGMCQYTKHTSNLSSMGASDDLMVFSNFIFTMKSAREHAIANPLDITAELLAQFLITGSVKFKRFEEWNFPTKFEVDDRELIDKIRRPPRRRMMSAMANPDANVDEMNRLISATEQRINEIIPPAMESIKGGVYLF
jgi:hypothetical protein